MDRARVAVYLVDWVLRRYRYVPGELQKTGPEGLYYGRRGVSWPALVAQLLGMCAAMAGLNPTFNVPGWANPVAVATGTDSFTRADFSIFMGMAVAGVATGSLPGAASPGRPICRTGSWIRPGARSWPVAASP